MDECVDGMFEKWYDKIDEEECLDDRRKVHTCSKKVFKWLLFACRGNCYYFILFHFIFYYFISIKGNSGHKSSIFFFELFFTLITRDS